MASWLRVRLTAFMGVTLNEAGTDCRPSAFPNHGSAGPALLHHHGQGGVPEYSSTYERVTGSIQRGSSFDGLLTRVLTGSTVIAR